MNQTKKFQRTYADNIPHLLLGEPQKTTNLKLLTFLLVYLIEIYTFTLDNRIRKNSKKGRPLKFRPDSP